MDDPQRSARFTLQLDYLRTLTVTDLHGEVLLWSGADLNQEQINELFRQHPKAVAVVTAHDYVLFARPLAQPHELRRPTIVDLDLPS